MIPPYWLWLEIAPANRRRFRLWLPLFFLWPLWLLLGAVYALVLLALWWVWIFSRRLRAWAWVPVRAWAVLCALPGTSVDIRGGGEIVRILIL